ncbi:SpaA isopeptide-forming pilin-related protein [Naumannella halotolerans]|uniref:DUF7927 domain-containing protein n=1 Tax=Naumannella halotolerans TaxID=993414 RepID=UPI00105EA24D|nr:SpaA isopeptide-forming pilin-related protein [Naumannella halotolerans]
MRQSWSKVDADDPEQYLGGSQWTLRGPDGDLTVVDNGESDTDDRAGRIQVNGLTWGDYTLVESSAPGGYLTDPTNRGPYTVDANNLAIGVGDVPNTEAVPGLVLRKIADPVLGSLVSPGQTITYTVTAANTGNVDLTPATVTDDLSDVLDDASYVEGSAAARIGEQTVDSPTVADDTLTWSGGLGVGETVTLTYQVRVDADVVATDRLVNVVVGEGSVPPGVTPPVSNCVPGQTNPECTTNHTPSPPSPTTPPSSPPTTAPSPSTPTTAPTPPSPPSTSVSPSASVPSGEPTSGGPLADPVDRASPSCSSGGGLSAAAAGGLLLRRRS